MSTPLPNVSDPCGYYGDIAVTVFCGPVELGDERRCIQLDGTYVSSGSIQMSGAQSRALADAIAAHAPRSPHARPRVIEAILGRTHRPVYVVVDNIFAIEIETGRYGNGVGEGGATAWLLMGRVVHADGHGDFACYRTFETMEAAHAFARETLG